MIVSMALLYEENINMDLPGILWGCNGGLL